MPAQTLTSRQNLTELTLSASLLRSYLKVRNTFLMYDLGPFQPAATAYLDLVAQLRRQAIEQQPSLRAYLAFMLGSHAATPVAGCHCYGPTALREMTVRCRQPERVTLIEALSRLPPDRLPLLIKTPRGRRGWNELVL